MKIYIAKIVDFSDGHEQMKGFTNLLHAQDWILQQRAEFQTEDREQDCSFDVQVWDTTESKVATIMTASS